MYIGIFLRYSLYLLRLSGTTHVFEYLFITSNQKATMNGQKPLKFFKDLFGILYIGYPLYIHIIQTLLFPV